MLIDKLRQFETGELPVLGPLEGFGEFGSSDDGGQVCQLHSFLHVFFEDVFFVQRRPAQVLLDPELQEVHRLVYKVEFFFSLLVEGHVLVHLQSSLPFLLAQSLRVEVLLLFVPLDVVQGALFTGEWKLWPGLVEDLLLELLLFLLSQRLQIGADFLFLRERALFDGGGVLLHFDYFVDLLRVLGLGDRLGQVDVLQLLVPNRIYF